MRMRHSEASLEAIMKAGLAVLLGTVAVLAIAMYVAPLRHQPLAATEMRLALDLLYGWITVCTVRLVSDQVRLEWSSVMVS